jgi:hypothetical protein
MAKRLKTANGSSTDQVLWNLLFVENNLK